MGGYYYTKFQLDKRDIRNKDTFSKLGITTWDRKITKVEWGKSACNVYYQVNNFECYKNIMPIVHKYAGRLNEAKRIAISAATPEHIRVIRDNKLCHERGMPYGQGVRTNYYFNEEDIKSWITTALK